MCTRLECKVAFESDPRGQMRIWHVSQLPLRGKVSDEHVTSVFGLMYATADQVQLRKNAMDNETRLLRDWALTRLRNMFIALSHRYKLLLDGWPVESWDDVRGAMAQALDTGTDEDKRNAKVV
eukprot:scaffold219720_cov26-Attheya_sp.AAC.1